MTDDDRRLAQRLRAYESRVPDVPAPTTSLGARPPWGVFAAAGLAAVLVGAVLATNLADDRNVGDVDATLTAEPTVSASPEATEPPASQASPTAAPSPTDAGPAPTAEPTAEPPPPAVAGVEWEDAASFTDGSAFRVTSEGGRFYILGSTGRDAAVWSSSDGTTWQVARLPFPSEWEGEDYGFVYADEMAAIDGRLLVAGEVGMNDYLEAVVWESTDGTTWREVDTGAFRQDAFNVLDLTAGPNELVAITHQYGAGTGSAWRSDDAGRTWTEHRPPGDGVSAAVVVGTTRGYLLAGAENESFNEDEPSSPRIWYSPDGTGTSWRLASLEGSGGRGRVEHLAIDAQARWVAVGTLNDRATVWRSLDRGLSWAVVASLGEVGDEQLAGYRVIGAPEGFVAVSGTDPALTWVSADGGTWVQTSENRPSGVADGLQIDWARGLARVGDRVVVVGEAFGPEGRPEEKWLSWAGTITR
jgi:hypothetical protein